SWFATDLRLARDNKTVFWIRLNQGEIIRTDPGPPPYIYPVRGPTRPGGTRVISSAIPYPPGL
ncbi:MAG: hypothetical protein ACRET7_01315, partial [Burkholderiales bacterium]